MLADNKAFDDSSNRILDVIEIAEIGDASKYIDFCSQHVAKHYINSQREKIYKSRYEIPSKKEAVDLLQSQMTKFEL